MFIHKSDISIAEPYDVQIDESGGNIITMYQFIGDIDDTGVGGLENVLNYMKTLIKMSRQLMNTIII